MASSTPVSTTTQPLIVNSQRVIYLGIALGYLLLPFSSGSVESRPPILNNPVTTILQELPVISLGYLPLLIVAAVIFSMLMTQRIHIHQGAFPFILFFCSSILFSLLFAQNYPPVLFRVSFQIIGSLIAIYIMSMGSRTQDTRRHAIRFFIRIFIISGVLLAGYYLFTVLIVTGQYGYSVLVTERGVGRLLALPWGASNTISATLIMPLFVALSNIELSRARNNRLETGLSIGGLLFILLAIFMTLSRTVLVVSIFGLVMYILHRRSSRVMIITLVLGLFIAPIIQTLIGFGQIATVFTSRIRDIDTILLANGRVPIWLDMINLSRQNFLLPIGYYESIYLYGFSAHNLFLTTLVEQGLIGLIAFVALLAKLIHTLAKVAFLIPRHENRHLAVSFNWCLIAIIINLQFEDPYFTQQYSFFFWLFIGLCFLISVDGERKLDSLRSKNGENGG